MNLAILIGNLGKDPDMKVSTTGSIISTFPIATQEMKNGEKTVQWHEIVVFGQLAENCNKYLKKGDKISVTGRIQTTSWTDSDGVLRKRFNIIANQIEFLEKPRKDQ